MAYFVVIGTDDNVKGVVDEMKQTHLQHNVVTTGCIVHRGGKEYYQWDVYNSESGKVKDGVQSGTLDNVLTAQISQFKNVIPANAVPCVFLIGQCVDEADTERVKAVYRSLSRVGGSTLSGMSIDVVLIGYDLERFDDVCVRPHWQVLRGLGDIRNGAKYQTNVLYINNMDYDGAATNLGPKLMGRLLSHWSTMISSGGVDPKQGVNSGYYAVGLAERQYDFEDLVSYFHWAAEERILDVALHRLLPATSGMVDMNYFDRIKLDRPWISGLCDIVRGWRAYCGSEFDYGKPASEQPYSLAVQERELAAWLNDWLKVYCAGQEQKREQLQQCREKVGQQRSTLMPELERLKRTDGDENDGEADGLDELGRQVEELERELSRLNREIGECTRRITANTFDDYRVVSTDYVTGLLTEKQRDCMETHKQSEAQLLEYLYSDDCVEAIEEAAKGADRTPELPQRVIEFVGVCVPPTLPASAPASQHQELDSQPSPTPSLIVKRSCFVGRLLGLFRREKTDSSAAMPATVASSPKPAQQTAPTAVRAALAEYRKVREVRNWWTSLCRMVEEKKERQKECLDQMSKYRPVDHPKSRTLIDMERVRAYRDTDSEFKALIDRLIGRFFDSEVSDGERKRLPELIDEVVVDQLRVKWSILRWDGSNPFCKEVLTNDDIKDMITHPSLGMGKQSRPFVEYVRQQAGALGQSIASYFYFNHPGIYPQPNVFRQAYGVGASMVPVYLEEFDNSLCEVQVMEVVDYVDAISDFKPKPLAPLHESIVDYGREVDRCVGTAETSYDKAKAIFRWLCDNIAYDVTLSIHDADTCWEKMRGVCQAYCELFCQLGKAVGLTVDIVSGKAKRRDGSIAAEPHAWVFVYTEGYEGILIDPTWGAGSVSEHGEFVRSSDGDMWFDVQPAWMVYTHYPDDKEWLKLDGIEDLLTEEAFAALPYVEPRKDCGRDQLDKDLKKKTT